MTSVPTTPDSVCPDWCVMHIQGRHHAEMPAPSFTNERYSVYIRETDEGDGEVGLEVVVVPHDGGDWVRVPVGADAVRKAAEMAAALGITAPDEGDTPDDDDR